MTAISIKTFAGMIPRTPGQLLPDNAAEWAENCDFSRNELGSLNGGLEVLNVGGQIRGMYTEEGQYWYTWPSDVVAYKSPVVNEIYQRIYYIDGAVLRASPSPQSVFHSGGGPPTQAPRVGVPNPTVVPVLALLDRTTLADYPAAGFAFKCWWTDGSANYGVTVITATAASAFKRYTFVAPAVPADVPEGAQFVVQATLTEGVKQLFQLDTGAASTMPARTQALPGGVAMSLEVVSVTTATPPITTYAIVFDWGVVETRAYVFTVSNTWDEESGPSPAALVSPTYLQDVQVTMVMPDFSLGYQPYKQTNVYRTYGGPQYVKAGSIVSTIYIDSARTVSSVGVSLPSLTWVPPPRYLFDLTLMPNGWFAGHYFNVLHMSEPFRPHTWPYSITFPQTILGICSGPQGIVVTTNSATFVVTGPHPHSVTSMEVPVPVGGIDAGITGGVTRRGMCAVDGGVAFLSNDGVVLVEGSQGSLEMSQHYFTRETWRAHFGNVLTTMQLGYHDGRLVATSSASPVGFILDLDESGGAMTRFNYTYDVMMRLPFLDTLYYSVNGRIYRFREGLSLDTVWISKQFITPKFTKFGIGFARMTGTGKITIKLYADSPKDIYSAPVPIHTLDLDPSKGTVYFRLPSHPGALKWQFQINTTGDCALQDLAFAQSPDELKNV